MLAPWILLAAPCLAQLPPLAEAARKGDVEALRRALDAGEELEEEFGHKTALMWAAENGRSEIVELLVQAGADVNHAKTRHGETCTAVLCAARAESTPTLRVLLAAGADPMLGADSWPQTLAHFVADAPDAEALEELAKAGLPLDADSEEWGGTPLHVAALAHRSGTIPFLLEHGARVDARGTLARTPLHLAAQAGNVFAVAALLAGGADRELTDQLGRSAAHLACEEGHVAVLAHLRWDWKRHLRSPSFMRADAQGWTPLALAAAFGHPRCMQEVLGTEESRRLCTLGTLRSPFHWAYRGGNAYCIELLHQLGAGDVEVDAFGLKPADLALARSPHAPPSDARPPPDAIELLHGLAAVLNGAPIFVLYQGPASGLHLAVWSDGLVLFAPDETAPDRDLRVGCVAPAQVEATSALARELGLFDLPDQFRVALHGGSVRLCLDDGADRRVHEWDLRLSAGIGRPRESALRSFENAWMLFLPELRALVPDVSLPWEDVPSGSTLRGYSPSQTLPDWAR